MGGIKPAIQAVRSRLAQLQYATNEQDAFGNAIVAPIYVRTWNNQTKWLEEGKTFAFPRPAAFLETLNEQTYEQLGVGYAEADLVFRVHCVLDFYDAGDETNMQQDDAIFDFRDAVIVWLSNYYPTGCDALMRIAERQAYSHKNLYEYEIDFITSFVDSKGSPYDTQSAKYIKSSSNLAAEIDTTLQPITYLPPIPPATQFRVPKQPGQ